MIDETLISAYHDGELSAAEAAECEARLAAAEELRRELAEIRTVSKLLRQLPPPAPAPDGLLRAVMARIAAGPAKAVSVPPRPVQAGRPRWFSVVAPLLATACTLVVLVGNGGMSLRYDAVRSYKSTLAFATHDSTSRGMHDSVINGAAFESAPESGIEAFVGAAAPSSPAGTDSLLPPGRVGEGAPGGLGAAAVGDHVESTEFDREVDELYRELEVRNRLLTNARPGDLLKSIDADGDRVSVLTCTVVDVRQGVDQIEYLLQKNSIVNLTARADPFADERKANAAVDKQGALPKTSELFNNAETLDRIERGEPVALYVCAPESNLKLAIADLLSQEEPFVEVQLEESLSVAQVENVYFGQIVRFQTEANGTTQKLTQLGRAVTQENSTRHVESKLNRARANLRRAESVAAGDAPVSAKSGVEAGRKPGDRQTGEGRDVRGTDEKQEGAVDRGEQRAGLRHDFAEDSRVNRDRPEEDLMLKWGAQIPLKFGLKEQESLRRSTRRPSQAMMQNTLKDSLLAERKKTALEESEQIEPLRNLFLIVKAAPAGSRAAGGGAGRHLPASSASEPAAPASRTP